MNGDRHARLARRSFLTTGGVGLATALTLGSATGQSELSVTFEDQQSDGESVVVAEIEAPIESLLIVRDETGTQVGGHPSGGDYRFGPDETVESTTVTLDTPVSDDQVLTARLQESNGSRWAEDDALISLDGQPPERVDGFGPTLVEANSDAGFEYPYFLYAPSARVASDPRPTLVEPNNTGTATDDFEKHRAAARETIRGGTGRDIADSLDAPFLVPVFPRPRADPVRGTHYVHALDDTTMGIESGPLERVDLQLLAMVDDANRRLRDRGYPVADGIMLNGFSASGNFVDRFAVLHPERVQSVTAGGLNGMALLPLEAADGQRLPFHVGIADVAALTGSEVDLDALDEVDQFLYMGGDDTNDTIPYDDAWTDDELRQTALSVYGDEMVTQRFPRCQAAYREVGVEAQFRVYDGVGHTPRPALDDIVEFHRRSIAGEDVSEFGENLITQPSFDMAPDRPAVGASVTFDATDSVPGIAGISRYLWNFGDDATAFGETVAHSFEEAGTYTVTLILIREDGTETRIAKELPVSVDGEVPTDTPTATETPTPTETPTATRRSTDTTTAADGPGLGIASGVAGLLSAGYLFRRSNDERDGS